MITPFDDFTIPEPMSGCLIWLGGTTEGYGKYWDGEKQHYAHVYALERKLGRKLVKGEKACHTCNVCCCVEENHLYCGNAQSNMDDKMKAGRWKGGNPPILTDEQIVLIRRIGTSISQQKIADMFGISNQHVSRIQNERKH